MTTTLITGANRGLGFEVARQLVAAGHRVWIGPRDEARGERAAAALDARFVQLDVTDDASVTAAAETVGELDVLVNNAGISGATPLGELVADRATSWISAALDAAALDEHERALGEETPDA